MDAGDILEMFRLEMDDAVAPYLWSDEEVLKYLDLAQIEFCRRTLGIVDSQSADFCELFVEADGTYVEISPKILKIKGARLANGRVVDVVNYENLETYAYNTYHTDYGMLTHNSFILDDRKGPEVRAIVTDMDPRFVRVIPVPTEDQTVYISVYRLPHEPIEDDLSELEIPEQHHYYMLYWMKYLALLKQDSETFDKNKAAEMRALFLEYCEQAKREQERREHKPRTVVYGGL